jgi:hypothetical protein
VPGALPWTSALTLAVAVLVGGCASGKSCAPVPPSAECPDLKLFGVGYNELREFHGPPIAQLQEVGDATYPACNVVEGCPGSEFGGSGATDVWVIPGVDYAMALVGVRESSDVLVIFVRVGVRPDQLALPT